MSCFSPLLRSSVFVAAFFFSVLCSAAVSPSNLHNIRATYTKITIGWQSADDPATVSGYKIYRNGTEIATTTVSQYTDTGLQSGSRYIYTVKAVASDGTISYSSPELAVSTMKSTAFDNSDKVETVVDAMHNTAPNNLTALSLISAVKSGFEAIFGSTITFSVIDDDIFSSFITEELNTIKTVAPQMSEADRLAAQTELSNLLQNSYGGNSFEDVYINGKLTELAEAHWQHGNRDAAIALYNLSLNYLKDQEQTVQSTLFRIVHINSSAITASSTPQEIITVLNRNCNTALRFFDFFPNSTSEHARFVYLSMAMNYFRYFPRLLEYNHYDFNLFNTALQLAENAIKISDDKITRRVYNRIAAWKLVKLKIVYTDSNGTPLNGTVKICNITAENDQHDLFYDSDHAYVDERLFTVTDGEVTIPIYSGHIYSIDAALNVAGGNPFKYHIETLPHNKGVATVYNNSSDPVNENLPDSSDFAEAKFILDKPAYPYNLTAVKSVDVFSLDWDYVAPTNFNFKYFKVMRGDQPVATVTASELKNIPLENDSGVYTYTVIAYDQNDNPSPVSRELTVIPNDPAVYSEYFDWLHSYFGEYADKMYSSDDPDNDGVSNYQEFLANSDPTRIPGPGPELVEQQSTYSKITIRWPVAFDGENGVTYKIMRNNIEVGSTTNTSFTDSGLIAGIAYAYRLQAFKANGVSTEPGPALNIRTIKPVPYDYSDKVRQLVDEFNPIIASEYTGTSLVSAVKSGLEAILGTSISFSVIDRNILDDFVEQELQLVRQVAPPMSSAERLAAKNELNNILNNSFGGNSFEHVYIKNKLTELAEAHWQAYLDDNTKLSSKAAAEALYQFSLNYLKDREDEVFYSLSRLAAMKLHGVDATTPAPEIVADLNEYRDTMLRFFTFFPDSHSSLAGNVYSTVVSRYFRFFPQLLSYDNYELDVFNSALTIAGAGLNTDDSKAQQRYDRIAAWEMYNLNISVVSSDGTPVSGSLVFKNISDQLFYETISGALPEDIRTVQLDGSPVTVPVYAGHHYDIAVKFDVQGGPPIEYTLHNASHTKGTAITFDPYNAPLTTTLPDGTDYAEMTFVTAQPVTPYNLRVTKLPDEFNLSWDWVAPSADYQLDHFTVYRGDSEIGSVTAQQMNNIPRILVDNSDYSYHVVAYDVNGVASPASPKVDVLPDFSKDEQAYFDWKFKYFGMQPMFANDDPDADGLTNYEEFLLGSNPTVAPVDDPKALLQNIQPGSKVKYYAGEWTQLPDFSKLKVLNEEILTDFQFDTSDVILGSGLNRAMGLTVEGFFDVPETGTYRFYLASDDGSKLFIDGVLIIDNDLVHKVTELRNEVILKGGIHSVRIEYFDKAPASPALLQLDWSSTTFARTSFAPAVWYTDEDNQPFYESLAWQKDRDSDGIVDVAEKQYGTDFNRADTDGDGITDGDEVFSYFTDPTRKDTDGDGVSDYEEIFMSHSDALKADMDLSTLKTVLKINATDYSAVKGSWGKVGNRFLYARSRRGSVEYIFELEQPYLYRLRLNAQQFFPISREMDIRLYIDDIYVGRRLITLKHKLADDIFFYLPWLKPGSHTVKIVWNNYRSASSLRINELEIQKIGGSDTNHNAIADWIEVGINKTSSMNNVTASRVSPLCLEGKAQYISLMTLNSTATAGRFGLAKQFSRFKIKKRPNIDKYKLSDRLTAAAIDNPFFNLDKTQAILAKMRKNFKNFDHIAKKTRPQLTDLLSEQNMKSWTEHPVRHAAGSAWYANVDLSPNGRTILVASFQNHVKNIVQSVVWTQTNIIAESGSEITIRKNDSLLLNAFPRENTAPHRPRRHGRNNAEKRPNYRFSKGAYLIRYNGQEYRGKTSLPTPLQFTEAGIYTLTADFSGRNHQTATGSITVKVVDYSFGDIEPDCWVGRARSWDIPTPGESVAIEPDSRFAIFEKSHVPMPAEISRYDITIDQNRDRYILARLGSAGPVIDQIKVKGFEIFSSNKTYVRQVDEYEDGTKLYEMLIISSPVMPDIELKLHIFVAGVIFDDGSIDKTVTAADFDDLGQALVYFLYPPEAQTSTCHTLKAYQNGIYVGVRR